MGDNVRGVKAEAVYLDYKCSLTNKYMKNFKNRIIMDYSKITLGELLSSQDDIIRRNAVSILKRYQNMREYKDAHCKHNCAYHDKDGNCTDTPS